jgi:predicted acetyltransferase
MTFRCRPATPDDHPGLARVLGQSFNFPEAERWQPFWRRVGPEGLFAVEEGGRIIGGCGVYDMGQRWLGRHVRLGGVAGVGVAPEHRGRGVARALMGSVLEDLARRGLPMAGLYPASQPVYRSVGYEQSGERILYELPLASLAGIRPELPMVQLEAQLPETEEALRARYAPEHGNLDRDGAMWERLLRPTEGRREVWLIGEAGYVVVQPLGQDIHWNVQVMDYAAPDAATARSLLGLCASLRSLCEKLRWYGSPSDLLLGLVPEVGWSVVQHQRWMLRLVDLGAALAGRGWAAEGQLELSVEDPLLPHNSGDWRLVVEGGQGRLERGRGGGLRMGPRALGPLYSGLYSASRLAQLGLLSGSVAGLQAADRLFAAPLPWMRDMY